MADTIPVTTLREPSTIFARTQTMTQLHLDAFTKTDDLQFISLAPSVGTTFLCLSVEA